jgi:hypothetical protein
MHGQLLLTTYILVCTSNLYIQRQRLHYSETGGACYSACYRGSCINDPVTEQARVLLVLCATVQSDRQRKEQLFGTGVFRQLSTTGSDHTGRYNDRT